jgi:ubiquitin-like protein Pup
MSIRIRKSRPKARKNVETPEQRDQAKQHLAADLDEVLDEIDEVLEQNAEEFVNSYVQKGGQ